MIPTPLICLCFGIVFGILSARPATADNSESDDWLLTRAVFADGRLWTVSGGGRLSSVASGDGKRILEALAEPVLEICRQDGHLVAVTGRRQKSASYMMRRRPSRWALWRRIDRGWIKMAVVYPKADTLLAMDCAAGRLTLATTRRLIDVTGGRQREVYLSEKLWLDSSVVVLGTQDLLFAGINGGEWGGGLRRIDRRTGVVTEIERNASGELCGGPLNTACDPVTGLAAIPWRPSCVAATIGLVHRIPRGRIVEICDDEVKRLYLSVYRDFPFSGVRKDGEPYPTVAFFGLVADAETLWAIGIDGLYRFRRDGAVTITPLPKRKTIGGINLSFDIPGFVLVSTAANQRFSMSGWVPLLVPR